MPRIAFIVCGMLLVALVCQPVVATSAVSPRQAWEDEWDRVRTEARKEGKVIITGNVGPATAVLRKALSEKIGINPEFIVGRGAEVVQRLIISNKAIPTT